MYDNLISVSSETAVRRRKGASLHGERPVFSQWHITHAQERDEDNEAVASGTGKESSEEEREAVSDRRLKQNGGLRYLLYSSVMRIGMRLAGDVFQYALAGEQVFRDVQEVYIGDQRWDKKLETLAEVLSRYRSYFPEGWGVTQNAERLKGALKYWTALKDLYDTFGPTSRLTLDHVASLLRLLSASSAYLPDRVCQAVTYLDKLTGSLLEREGRLEYLLSREDFEDSPDIAVERLRSLIDKQREFLPVHLQQLTSGEDVAQSLADYFLSARKEYEKIRHSPWEALTAFAGEAALASGTEAWDTVTRYCKECRLAYLVTDNTLNGAGNMLERLESLIVHFNSDQTQQVRSSMPDVIRSVIESAGLLLGQYKAAQRLYNSFLHVYTSTQSFPAKVRQIEKLLKDDKDVGRLPERLTRPVVAVVGALDKLVVAQQALTGAAAADTSWADYVQQTTDALSEVVRDPMLANLLPATVVQDVEAALQFCAVVVEAMTSLPDDATYRDYLRILLKEGGTASMLPDVMQPMLGRVRQLFTAVDQWQNASFPAYPGTASVADQLDWLMQLAMDLESTQSIIDMLPEPGGAVLRHASALFRSIEKLPACPADATASIEQAHVLVQLFVGNEMQSLMQVAGLDSSWMANYLPGTRIQELFGALQRMTKGQTTAQDIKDLSVQLLKTDTGKAAVRTALPCLPGGALIGHAWDWVVGHLAEVPEDRTLTDTWVGTASSFLRRMWQGLKDDWTRGEYENLMLLLPGSTPETISDAMRVVKAFSVDDRRDAWTSLLEGFRSHPALRPFYERFINLRLVWRVYKIAASTEDERPSQLKELQSELAGLRNLDWPGIETVASLLPLLPDLHAARAHLAGELPEFSSWPQWTSALLRAAAGSDVPAVRRLREKLVIQTEEWAVSALHNVLRSTLESVFGKEISEASQVPLLSPLNRVWSTDVVLPEPADKSHLYQFDGKTYIKEQDRVYRVRRSQSERSWCIPLGSDESQWRPIVHMLGRWWVKPRRSTLPGGAPTRAASERPDALTGARSSRLVAHRVGYPDFSDDVAYYGLPEDIFSLFGEEGIEGAVRLHDFPIAAGEERSLRDVARNAGVGVLALLFIIGFLILVIRYLRRTRTSTDALRPTERIDTEPPAWEAAVMQEAGDYTRSRVNENDRGDAAVAERTRLVADKAPADAVHFEGKTRQAALRPVLENARRTTSTGLEHLTPGEGSATRGIFPSEVKAPVTEGLLSHDTVPTPSNSTAAGEDAPEESSATCSERNASASCNGHTCATSGAAIGATAAAALLAGGGVALYLYLRPRQATTLLTDADINTAIDDAYAALPAFLGVDQWENIESADSRSPFGSSQRPKRGLADAQGFDKSKEFWQLPRKSNVDSQLENWVDREADWANAYVAQDGDFDAAGTKGVYSTRTGKKCVFIAGGYWEMTEVKGRSDVTDDTRRKTIDFGKGAIEIEISPTNDKWTTSVGGLRTSKDPGGSTTSEELVSKAQGWDPSFALHYVDEVQGVEGRLYVDGRGETYICINGLMWPFGWVNRFGYLAIVRAVEQGDERILYIRRSSWNEPWQLAEALLPTALPLSLEQQVDSTFESNADYQERVFAVNGKNIYANDKGQNFIRIGDRYWPCSLNTEAASRQGVDSTTTYAVITSKAKGTSKDATIYAVWADAAGKWVLAEKHDTQPVSRVCPTHASTTASRDLVDMIKKNAPKDAAAKGVASCPGQEGGVYVDNRHDLYMWVAGSYWHLLLVSPYVAVLISDSSSGSKWSQEVALVNRVWQPLKDSRHIVPILADILQSGEFKYFDEAIKQMFSDHRAATWGQLLRYLLNLTDELLVKYYQSREYDFIKSLLQLKDRLEYQMNLLAEPVAALATARHRRAWDEDYVAAYNEALTWSAEEMDEAYFANALTGVDPARVLQAQIDNANASLLKIEREIEDYTRKEKAAMNETALTPWRPGKTHLGSTNTRPSYEAIKKQEWFASALARKEMEREATGTTQALYGQELKELGPLDEHTHKLSVYQSGVALGRKAEKEALARAGRSSGRAWTQMQYDIAYRSALIGLGVDLLQARQEGAQTDRQDELGIARQYLLRRWHTHLDYLDMLRRLENEPGVLLNGHSKYQYVKAAYRIAREKYKEWYSKEPSGWHQTMLAAMLYWRCKNSTRQLAAVGFDEVIKDYRDEESRLNTLRRLGKAPENYATLADIKPRVVLGSDQEYWDQFDTYLKSGSLDHDAVLMVGRMLHSAGPDIDASLPVKQAYKIRDDVAKKGDYLYLKIEDGKWLYVFEPNKSLDLEVKSWSLAEINRSRPEFWQTVREKWPLQDGESFSGRYGSWAVRLGFGAKFSHFVTEVRGGKSRVDDNLVDYLFNEAKSVLRKQSDASKAEKDFSLGWRAVGEQLLPFFKVAYQSHWDKTYRPDLDEIVVETVLLAATVLPGVDLAKMPSVVALRAMAAQLKSSSLTARALIKALATQIAPQLGKVSLDLFMQVALAAFDSVNPLQIGPDLFVSPASRSIRPATMAELRTGGLKLNAHYQTKNVPLDLHDIGNDLYQTPKSLASNEPRTFLKQGDATYEVRFDSDYRTWRVVKPEYSGNIHMRGPAVRRVEDTGVWETYWPATGRGGGRLFGEKEVKHLSRTSELTQKRAQVLRNDIRRAKNVAKDQLDRISEQLGKGLDSETKDVFRAFYGDEVDEASFTIRISKINDDIKSYLSETRASTDFRYAEVATSHGNLSAKPVHKRGESLQGETLFQTNQGKWEAGGFRTDDPITTAVVPVLEDVKERMSQKTWEGFLQENLIHEGFHAIKESPIDVYPGQIDLARGVFDIAPLVRLPRPWMSKKTLSSMLGSRDDARRALREIGVVDLPGNAGEIPKGRSRKYSDAEIEEILNDSIRLKYVLREEVFGFRQTRLFENPENFAIAVTIIQNADTRKSFLERYKAWLLDTDKPLTFTF